MYDIIGDIHGYTGPLIRLLEKLDYTKSNGTWQHPGRKVIFVGDYIDRGPAIRETLQIVKGMVDSGNAIALMGNHEYNALAYHSKVRGKHLREHNEKNTQQHQSTLAQFWDYREEWAMYLEWFYTLPLFFEDEGIRVVHACWDEDNIQWLKANKYVTMTVELLINGHNKELEPLAWKAIEETLKGKEFDIPKKYAWKDKGGQLRTSNRIKWWVDPHANVYGNWLFDSPSEMEALQIRSDSKPYLYPADAPPVFFGHYWLEDGYPVIQEKNVVCLDYSIAREGSLVGYRWCGEKELVEKNFVKVNYKEMPEIILSA
jgi:hypothetical protein